MGKLYPLHLVRPETFKKFSEHKKQKVISSKVSALQEIINEKNLVDKVKIELGEQNTPSQNMTILNQIVQTIRGDSETKTNRVIELYENLIKKNNGDYKSIHKEITKKLIDVPEPSVRRILSLHRRGLR